MMEQAMEARPTKANSFTGSSTWAEKLRKNARDASRRADEAFLELATHLHLVWDTPVDGNPEKPPIFTLWGYTSYDDYAKRELNLSQKQASRLRRIGYMMHVVLKGAPKELVDRMRVLGVSRLRELTRVITSSNAEGWVGVAEKLNFVQLEENIKKKLAEHEEDVEAGRIDEEALPDAPDINMSEERDSELFWLTPEQRELLLQAFNVVQKTTGRVGKATNLEYILMDFIATNDVAKGRRKLNVAKVLSRMENFLGVKLIAVNPNSRDIEYGVEGLKLLVDDGKEGPDGDAPDYS
jgi:hypothetical protein